MTDDAPPPLVNQPEADAAERSLVDDMRQLAEDGRTLIEAEIAYQKSRAVVAGGGLKSAALFGGLALILLFFVLMALVMGLLLALTPLIGAWGALGAVVGGLLIGAIIAALIAKSRWTRTAALIAEPKDKP